jgi:hypothetical protein
MAGSGLIPRDDICNRYSNSYKSWQMSEPLHIAWLNGHGCLRQAPQGIFNKRPLSGEKQSQHQRSRMKE